MKSLILVALLLTVGFCASRKPVSHFLDTKSVFAEIDKDHFGSTFISAIALNMATNSPIEEITLLLDEIIAEVTQDQAAADEKNRTD